MKVYISADMEGVTGLSDAEDVQPGGRDYERGRVMMTEDVNAAVRGALRAGATSVLVNDAHGPMRNLLPELLHPVARLIKGRPKPMGMLEGLTGDFDAVLCVGFHARAGTLGVLSHSFMGHEIEDMWLDDRPVGEIGLLHATAGALGVPVVLLSGDDAACAEMSDWDSGVTTVQVKRAVDRFAAEMRPTAEARTAIEEAAASALGAVRPDGTAVEAADLAVSAAALALIAAATDSAGADGVTLAVRWQSATVASHLLGIPGVKLRDSRTAVVTGTPADLYRLFGVFLRVATAVTNNQPYC